jgi:hypothetical protein
LSAFSPLITKPLAKIFTDTVISCSALLPATSVATMVTVSLCTDVCTAIFGKTDSAVINLSAIGTGGFVINGESVDNWSGYSVSNAGDVNGDGLDDLSCANSR